MEHIVNHVENSNKELKDTVQITQNSGLIGKILIFITLIALALISVVFYVWLINQFFSNVLPLFKHLYFISVFFVQQFPFSYLFASFYLVFQKCFYFSRKFLNCVYAKSKQKCFCTVSYNRKSLVIFFINWNKFRK